jgi:NAD dependent epimerase/dehydratase family enzyme
LFFFFAGVVLGRSGGMIKQLFLPFFLGLGGPVGRGDQYMPWIHIHDMASLFLFAIENDNVQGVLNGVAPQVCTIPTNIFKMELAVSSV